MKNRFRFGLKTLQIVLCLFVLLGGFARAAAPTGDYDPTQRGSKPIEDLPETTGARRNFLWEVRSSANTVYLFGTIHVGKRSFYPLPQVVEDALARSEMLVVEADPGKPASAAEVDRMIFFAPSDGLNQHISPALYQRVLRHLTRLKLDEARAQRLRPFLLATLLSVEELKRLGYDPAQGVERYLMAAARRQEKGLAELESEAMQIKLFADMSDKLQAAFLENALDVIERERTADQVTGMVNAWQTGDVALMQEVAETTAKDKFLRAELDRVLLSGRHPAMLTKIESYLFAERPVFVAVGALHLVGKDGLLAALRAKGYRLRQL